jgi:hypothetical protein
LDSIGGHFTAKLQPFLLAAVALLNSLKWCKPPLPLLAFFLVLALQFAFLLLLTSLRFVPSLYTACFFAVASSNVQIWTRLRISGFSYS